MKYSARVRKLDISKREAYQSKAKRTEPSVNLHYVLYSFLTGHPQNMTRRLSCECSPRGGTRMIVIWANAAAASIIAAVVDFTPGLGTQ